MSDFALAVPGRLYYNNRMFPRFEPSKYTFIGMVAGVMLVAVIRAALHF